MIYNNIARLLTHLSDLELKNTILNTGTSLKITLNVTPSYLNKKKYKGTIMTMSKKRYIFKNSFQGI